MPLCAEQRVGPLSSSYATSLRRSSKPLRPGMGPRIHRCWGRWGRQTSVDPGLAWITTSHGQSSGSARRSEPAGAEALQVVLERAHDRPPADGGRLDIGDLHARCAEVRGRLLRGDRACMAPGCRRCWNARRGSAARLVTTVLVVLPHPREWRRACFDMPKKRSSRFVLAGILGSSKQWKRWPS